MKKNNLKWYDDGYSITNCIIITILLVIICSQSFAIIGGGTFSLLSSVINHNSVYVLVLVYFVMLKFRFGKKYFDYLNVFLVFIYFLYSLTSLLTIIQSFSLTTIVNLLINFALFIYIVHSLLKESLLWKELKLEYSPFNDIPNDIFYYILIVLVSIELIVNLISTVVVSGLLVSILDAIYVLLLARYVYLYNDYLDNNHVISNGDNVKDEDNNGDDSIVAQEKQEEKKSRSKKKGDQ